MCSFLVGGRCTAHLLLLVLYVSCVYDSLCTTHLLLGLSALKEEEEKQVFSFLGYVTYTTYRLLSWLNAKGRPTNYLWYLLSVQNERTNSERAAPPCYVQLYIRSRSIFYYLGLSFANIMVLYLTKKQ